MHILQSITDIFNWLESTGILAALGAFVLVVIKQVQPYLKTHIKEKQMAQLTDFALATVTKFAQLASLSKSDRKKAALQDATNFAKQMGLTWATPELIDSIVESAYQHFKKLGYDNHLPVKTEAPSETADAQLSTNEPEAAAEHVSQQPQTDVVTQPAASTRTQSENNGSDANV
ncbi:phage holin, LLH family [Lentilactobacillus sunkii]|uniref:Phage holin, LL-H family n=1 Tax=Lentilactobacillus sunkii DSM 19904 TaxID=1423808 RepID=A0A0R1L4L1_9LACO|nr:phage holin, LLH family [Lentilactobacillus sunkii]KRK86263.1 hypothetical protein FD17_GL002086 [Lentilactobacillus sunkii DSM 19904]